ncbi:ZIP family metal transporter [Parasulfuritortus cantonensis]|uniref:ZIP family metal transporter n=1 Tax=Parasulfuritortus cantonensis TaxID=2528202 RepID=A0A4R1BGJ0_9PROT|nr:ZIP family metal transporter [Parasulfuritortus cantonensis]TCJ16346.1 ZIP family metal transporter [Parasulfuritortus cantonensis]
MADGSAALGRGFGQDWNAHLQRHPWAAGGLALAGAALVWLLGASLWQQAEAGNGNVLRYAALGGLAGLAATSLGALPALFLRGIAQRTEDVMLGLAAGMMLAASSFSLLTPGLEAGASITGSAGLGAATVVAGMALGVMLMLGLDEFTPHEHENSGPCGPGCERIGRVWLFVLAIALHNLPEGMAIGVSFARGDLNVGLPLTSAIALQDIPEGLAVAMALRGAGLGVGNAVLVAAATGVMEPLGALLGIGLTSGLAIAYPVGLGLAAGAMLFVVSHEVIPETHRNGHQTPATLGLMAGFAIMMVLDTTLG